MEMRRGPSPIPPPARFPSHCVLPLLSLLLPSPFPWHEFLHIQILLQRIQIFNWDSSVQHTVPSHFSNICRALPLAREQLFCVLCPSRPPRFSFRCVSIFC